MSSAESHFLGMKSGDTIDQGDTLRTGPDGAAAILSADESLMRLNANTTVRFIKVSKSAEWLEADDHRSAASAGRVSTYRVDGGEMWLRNKNQHIAITIQSTDFQARVTGTELDLLVLPEDRVIMTVQEGLLIASNPLGRMRVAAGEKILAIHGKPMEKQMMISWAESVQWTLTLPDLPVFLNWPSAQSDLIQHARKAIWDRDLVSAKTLLGQALRVEPDNAHVWSLDALVALLTGDRQAAMTASQKAVAFGPHDTFALLIRSYAQQADTQLDAATQTTQRILAIDPDDTLARVRLAQLKFAGGYTRQADRIVTHAIAKAPDSATAQHTAGFIHLALRRSAAAGEAFSHAIRLDTALGEPHLGLALIAMRQGDEKRAMQEMSKAVLLEPQRAIYLSYWGKMLYQLKRFHKALDMLDQASRLDPHDPTPHYVRSLILSDLNRPTEAIAALQTAMALNDNRAVYRSRFLLDQDLSMKNIDLSFLYRQMGLSEWAVSKANAAVKQDYANSSAHLFLGSALTETEDRTQCAMNELLLAMIMQPANQNTFNAFNDYTAFFESPEIDTTVEGRVGDNDSFGGAVYVNGSHPPTQTAFDFYAFYRKDGGFRENEDAYRGRVNGRIKWNATERDHFLLQGGVIDADYEYTVQSGINEIDAPSHADDYTETDTIDIEIGYHHRFSPGADLILYGAHTRGPTRLFYYTDYGTYDADAPDVHLFTRTFLEENTRASRVQAQQMLVLGDHHGTLGIFHLWGDPTANTEDLYYLDYQKTTYPLAWDRQATDGDQRLTSLYLRDFWQITPWLAVDAAIYQDWMTNVDLYADTQWDIEETSPRLGMVLSPRERDTIRIAGFRYLEPYLAKRVDASDIAGIPIYRSTLPGTVTDEFDLVWEHEWQTGLLRSGIYYLTREYEAYVRTATYDGNAHRFIEGEAMAQVTESDARGLNLAWNQLIGNGWGVAVSYELWKTQDEIVNAVETDQRLDQLGMVSLSWVAANGLSARLKETWRNTDFIEQNRERENLFITDVSLSYEFPQKRGLIRLAVDNLFDETFNWITNINPYNGRRPAREWLFSVEVNI